jgi:hypothetical protein
VVSAEAATTTNSNGNDVNDGRNNKRETQQSQSHQAHPPVKPKAARPQPRQRQRPTGTSSNSSDNTSAQDAAQDDGDALSRACRVLGGKQKLMPSKNLRNTSSIIFIDSSTDNDIQMRDCTQNWQ